MKNFFLTFIIILFSNQLYADESLIIAKGFKEVKSNPLLPSIVYLNEEGNNKSLSDLKNKITVLHFWATWCGPCQKELPSLDKLIEKFKNDNIRFLAISADKGGVSTIKHFLTKNNLKNINAASDPTGTIQRTIGIRGLPTTLIINKKGEIVYKLEGSVDWLSDNLISFLKIL